MADELQLQLFGFWPSPYSRIVELALKLKGLHYQYIEEDARNKKSNLLLKYNPIYKKVPVLVYNGKPISESLLILEYIEENWRHNPILPQHPYQRAQARFWAKYINGKVLDALWKVGRSQREKREKAIEEACKALEPLENELKNKKFFGGDHIGLVDIVGIFVGYWIPVMHNLLGFRFLATTGFQN